MKKADIPSKFMGPFVGLLYFIAAWYGYRLRIVSGLPPMFWFSNGVAIAGFILVGFRILPWIALSSICFNLARGFPLISCPVLVLGNVASPAVAAWLFIVSTSSRPSFRTVREVLYFFAFVLGVGTWVGSGIETLGLWMGNFLFGGSFFASWFEWWVDEALGTLVLVPLVLVLFNDPKRGLGRFAKWDWQVLPLILAVLLVGIFSYTPLVRFNPTVLLRPYLLFPIMIWAVLRYGILGSILTLSLTAGCITVGLLNGIIPAVVGKNVQEQILLQEGFFLVFGLTGLVIAASLREKEEALQTRDGFLSVASHELKTPLTTLKIQTQLRRRKLLKGDRSLLDPENSLGLLVSDEKQINRLVRLVDDMFDMSRLTSGKFSLEKERVDLWVLVRDVVERLKLQLESSGCELTFHGAYTAPIYGYWDPYRLEQSISNLITNATKYGSGKPIQLHIERFGVIARVSVQDQGIGIAEGDHERIFRPYERAVKASEVSGLGLGLYISREIVEAHGGRISVWSVPGQGSTFSIELPIGDVE